MAQHKRFPIQVTIAIAEAAPVGILSVNMKKGLSQLYLLDTRTDKLTPGQFVKADATVQSISADGKYFSYLAFSHYRIPSKYVCIARPPYFTALAFFPTSKETPTGINFVDGNQVILKAKNDSEVPSEITAGCPLNFDTESKLISGIGYVGQDSPRNRILFARSNVLYERSLLTQEESVIHEFAYLDFQNVVPPEWAKVW